LDRLAKRLTLILLLIGACVFIWGSDKSFDFTDEGLYLLVYQNPLEFPDSYTSYHRVGAVVSQWVGGNIIALRLIGFFLTGLATLYFSTSLIWFVKGRGLPLFENSPERTLLHLALQGSVLSAYCWLPPTPNYNTMAGIGMLISCGGILSFFANPNPRYALGQALAGVLAMGSGLLLAFLAKGSSAVGIVVISGLLLGMCSLFGGREKVIFVAVASVSVLAVGVYIFLLMPSLFVSWEFLLGSIVALTEGNGAREIIVRHWQESMDFAMRHFRSFLLPIILALGVGFYSRFRFFKKFRDRKNDILVWLVLGVLVSEVILLIVRDVFSAGIQGRAKSFIGYSSLFLVILTLRAGIPGFGKSISPFRIVGFLVFLLWLAVLPFVTAAGTTHKIFINALLHAAPISAAILLLASSLDKDLRKSVVVPFASVLLAGMGFSQFIYGFFITPYRSAPKWAQTVPVEVGVPATILKLDPASADCIEKTKIALRVSGFKPGDDILALYGLPGLVYAVGGVSPQKPWFFYDHGPDGDEKNLQALKRIPVERIKSSHVFWTDNDSRVVSQLSSCGVLIKEEFVSTGQVKVPFKNRSVEIMRPTSQKKREM
jgi:hypothetical protein